MLLAVPQWSRHYSNSHVIWAHAVLPATRQRKYYRHNPSRSWYPIFRPPPQDERVSWSESVSWRQIALYYETNALHISPTRYQKLFKIDWIIWKIVIRWIHRRAATNDARTFWNKSPICSFLKLAEINRTSKRSKKPTNWWDQAKRCATQLQCACVISADFASNNYRNIRLLAD